MNKKKQDSSLPSRPSFFRENTTIFSMEKFLPKLKESEHNKKKIWILLLMMVFTLGSFAGLNFYQSSTLASKESLKESWIVQKRTERLPASAPFLQPHIETTKASPITQEPGLSTEVSESELIFQETDHTEAQYDYHAHETYQVQDYESYSGHN